MPDRVLERLPLLGHGFVHQQKSAHRKRPRGIKRFVRIGAYLLLDDRTAVRILAEYGGHRFGPFRVRLNAKLEYVHPSYRISSALEPMRSGAFPLRSAAQRNTSLILSI